MVTWNGSGIGPDQGLNFGIPQSRGRTYGISIKTSGGIDSATQNNANKKLDSAWEFVDRCKVQGVEPLHSLLQRTRKGNSSADVSEERGLDMV